MIESFLNTCIFLAQKERGYIGTDIIDLVLVSSRVGEFLLKYAADLSSRVFLFLFEMRNMRGLMTAFTRIIM